MKTSVEILDSLNSALILKKELPYYKRALSAWLGGAYLSLGGLLALSFGSLFAHENFLSAASLAYACTFPVGLLLIVLTKVDLFTSNCMISTIALWYGRKSLTLFPLKNKGGRAKATA